MFRFLQPVARCLLFLCLPLLLPTLLKAQSDADRQLIQAAEEGEFKKVFSLISQKPKPNLNFRQPDGVTALMAASAGGNLQIVDTLLKSGASADTRGPNGEQAIHHAAEHGHLHVLKLLATKKARIQPTNAGLTPLMMAAANGNSDCVSFLIKLGDSVNATQPNGWTPLMHAAANGNETAVEVLLKAGANVGAKNSKGQTASAVADEHGYGAIAGMLR